MKTPHTISLDSLYDWESWVIFASSTSERKRLLAKSGSPLYRVIHGKEIIFEGASAVSAVDRYNSIVGKPDEESVKLDN